MLTRWWYISNISPQFFWRFFPIFSRYFTIFWRYLPIFRDICERVVIFCTFKYFCIFYFADILTMFAEISADNSDNFFLDPWRYIHRHDICNIDFDHINQFHSWHLWFSHGWFPQTLPAFKTPYYVLESDGDFSVDNNVMTYAILVGTWGLPSSMWDMTMRGHWCCSIVTLVIEIVVS